MCSMLDLQNKHFEVSHIVSSVFTGREAILKRLASSLLGNGQSGQRTQSRFVLYGLGGSGKTQLCLKFTQEYRER